MIRHATYGDMTTCLDLIEKAHALSENYKSIFDMGVCRQSLAVRIMNPYSLVLLTEKEDGILVAGASNTAFSKELKVFDEIIYAGSGGVALIREYLKWGKRFGEDVDVYIGSSFGGDNDRFHRLVLKLGLKEIGKLYKVV